MVVNKSCEQSSEHYSCEHECWVIVEALAELGNKTFKAMKTELF